jgi:hypothetical protein
MPRSARSYRDEMAFGAGLGASAVSTAVAAVSLAAGSRGRTTATGILDDQDDDQDDQTDDQVGHRARRFRQAAPQRFTLTGMGPPDAG